MNQDDSKKPFNPLQNNSDSSAQGMLRPNTSTGDTSWFTPQDVYRLADVLAVSAFDLPELMEKLKPKSAQGATFVMRDKLFPDD